MSEPIGGDRSGGGAGAEPSGGAPPPGSAPRGFAMVAADADLDLAGSELPPRPSTVTLLRRTSRTLSGSFRRFITLSLIVHSPLLLLTAAVIGMVAAGIVGVEALLAVNAVVTLSGGVFSALVAATLVQAVFESLRGGRVEIGHSARIALRRLGPVIGVTILAGLATAGGFLVCIVPGIIVACGLFIAMPALLVERIGVSDALSRSWRLTGGYKLSIFGLLLLILLIEFGFGMILGLTLGGTLESASNLFVYLPALILFTVFTTTLRGVAAVVAYHDVRQFREGLDEDELAAVFE